MGHDPKGMDRTDWFALVIYIPDPLGRFLDDLRRELVPGFVPHAHVTILPPRHLSGDVETAYEQARVVTEEFAPFDIHTARCEKFPLTDVIYLSLSGGDAELRYMHKVLNTGALEYKEPYSYHPHITLAQDLNPEEVDRLYKLACCRWDEYSYNRSFRAETVAFVQNTAQKTWIDLGEFTLGAVSSVR